MIHKIFTCWLVVCLANTVSGQQPVYPKPGEDQAKYLRKEKPPLSHYENYSIRPNLDSPPKDYLQTVFDKTSKQFRKITAGNRFGSGLVNAPITKSQSQASKPPVSTATCFHLTKDINAATGNSYPQNLIPYGAYSFAVIDNVSYFSADDGIHGAELWRSDGTAGGTHLVKDINPGPAGSNLNGIIAANGLLFFYAETIDNGLEAWVSNGTETGTHLLIDINYGPNSSYPNQFVEAGNSVFFVTSLFGYNHQLWKTDGTETGTSLVKDLQPENIGYHILELTAVNDVVYFIAYTWAGFQLFRSDGTDVGTSMVKQIGYTYEYTAPMHLTAYNNQLYFSVDDGTGGRRLWVSDGTEAGTNYAPGFNDVFIHQEFQSIYSNEPFSIFNNILYLSGFTYTEGSGLYKYDASNSDGIVLVKDLSPSWETMLIPAPDMEIVNDRMFFKVISYTDGLPHDELWTTDGLAANTLPVKVFVNGEGIFSFYNSSGDFFFSKFDYVNGQELWKSDGTDAGTLIVKDIIAGTAGSVPENLTFCNGKLLFRATDIEHGMEVWSTNGTESGTSLVKDINHTSTVGSEAGFIYKGIASSGNGVIFGALTPEHGVELYTSDGTNNGTSLLNEITPGTDWSYPNSIIYKNGFNYFIGDNAVGTTIYRTDGKPTGLNKLVYDIDRSIYYVTNFNITDNGTPFYILGYRNYYAFELWVSDGTATGTIKLASNLLFDSYIVTLGNTVYFAAGDDAHGIELWKSDGTLAGTKMVRDIYPGGGNSFPYSLFVYKKEVYFGAYDGVGIGNYQLWKSDGSQKGTVKVKNITPARYEYAYNPDAQVFCNSNNILYFSGTDFQTYGAELWKTNGTAASTMLVKDISPQAHSFPNYLTDVNGTLYFSADDGVNGTELWSSKGTSNSTKLVKDIAGGYSSSYPYNFCGVGNSLYFINGTENRLWFTDGTADNTRQVTDPGLNGVYNFGRLVNGAGKLFFGAGTPAYGSELFVGDVCVTNITANRTAVTQLDPVKPELVFDAFLYPNPSTGATSLKLSGEEKNVTVTITDISGKVYWQSIFNNATQVNLPADKLANGIYIVTVKGTVSTKTLKLIKQ